MARYTMDNQTQTNIASYTHTRIDDPTYTQNGTRTHLSDGVGAEGDGGELVELLLHAFVDTEQLEVA